MPPSVCGTSDPDRAKTVQQALRQQTAPAMSCSILTAQGSPGNAALSRCICRHVCRLRLPGDTRTRISYPPRGLSLETVAGRVQRCEHRPFKVDLACADPVPSVAALASGKLEALDPAGTRVHLPGLELVGVRGRFYGSDISDRPSVLRLVRLRATHRGQPGDAPRNVQVKAAWLVKTGDRQATRWLEAQALHQLVLRRTGQTAQLARRTLSIPPCTQVGLQLEFRGVTSKSAQRRAVRLRLRVDGHGVELEVPLEQFTFVGEPDLTSRPIRK